MRLAAVLLPAAISVAWIPLRQHLPNVDVALALVLAVTACGATGRRSHVVVAAAGAAAGFAFFDTRPFERWAISRQPDLETLILLAVVSLVTGELAVRATRPGRAATSGEDGGLSPVREIAALVASGAELLTVLAAVGAELTRLLEATACTYEAGPSPAGALVVGPDGVAGRTGTHPAGSRRAPGTGDGGDRVVEVPVTGMNQVLGRFVVSDPAPAALQHERLIVALTLADQVAAALIAQAPDRGISPTPSRRRRPADPPGGRLTLRRWWPSPSRSASPAARRTG